MSWLCAAQAAICMASRRAWMLGVGSWRHGAWAMPSCCSNAPLPSWAGLGRQRRVRSAWRCCCWVLVAQAGTGADVGRPAPLDGRHVLCLHAACGVWRRQCKEGATVGAAAAAGWGGCLKCRWHLQVALAASACVWGGGRGCCAAHGMHANCHHHHDKPPIVVQSILPGPVMTPLALA